ncbi:Ubiquitin-conjugating enzyme E2 7 [Heracleum sosnowskyi]|uniref:Ubiquitin-conjugating enzyme E2 7 n=1 Tax=Heracleum sosnowskyi TaxID=360622 RepID=A0AAD8GVJ5_9APIA|nr:Ubiquitin-conjugating enzyme E2 7 [Heracleum sosnowskyi]
MNVALSIHLKDLCKNPVDGFSVGLVDESNLFEWSVTIIGPPDTLYDGGFFNAIMTFPQNYLNSPPTVRFTSEIWHPNVYSEGKVCISILHPLVMILMDTSSLVSAGPQSIQYSSSDFSLFSDIVQTIVVASVLDSTFTLSRY